MSLSKVCNFKSNRRFFGWVFIVEIDIILKWLSHIFGFQERNNYINNGQKYFFSLKYSRFSVYYWNKTNQSFFQKYKYWLVKTQMTNNLRNLAFDKFEDFQNDQNYSNQEINTVFYRFSFKKIFFQIKKFQNIEKLNKISHLRKNLKKEQPKHQPKTNRIPRKTAKTDFPLQKQTALAQKTEWPVQQQRSCFLLRLPSGYVDLHNTLNRLRIFPTVEINGGSDPRRRRK